MGRSRSNFLSVSLLCQDNYQYNMSYNINVNCTLYKLILLIVFKRCAGVNIFFLKTILWFLLRCCTCMFSVTS